MSFKLRRKKKKRWTLRIRENVLNIFITSEKKVLGRAYIDLLNFVSNNKKIKCWSFHLTPLRKLTFSIDTFLVRGATKSKGLRAHGSRGLWQPALLTGCHGDTWHATPHVLSTQQASHYQDSCQKGASTPAAEGRCTFPDALPWQRLKSLHWSWGQSECQNVPLRCHAIC